MLDQNTFTETIRAVQDYYPHFGGADDKRGDPFLF